MAVNKSILSSFIALSILPAVACTTDDAAHVDESGLRVSAALQVLPDLGGVEFRLSPAMCRPGDGFVPSDPLVYGVDVTMLALPDGTPFDAADDYDASMVAEDFLPIPAGCYTFIAAPVTRSGEPVAGCTSFTRDVVVSEGSAADLDFVIECGEQPRSEGTTNQPPTIDNVTINQQVSACEATLICATASDPDHDMLDFTWDISSLGGATEPALVRHWLDGDRALTQCIVVQANEAGSYDIGLTVHDVTRFTDDAGKLSEPTRIEDETGVESHATQAITLDATLGCEATGRSAVVMLTLANTPGMDKNDARQLINNLVDWVTPDATAPVRVLVVLDDAHYGEDEGDAKFVAEQMKVLGYTVTSQLEQPDGLVWADIQAYDAIWFVNPGHPMDDPQTHTALLRFRNQGGGLILQGDDMAHFWGAPEVMQPLTYLDYQNNGTLSCGWTTDNNAGANYRVEFGTGTHPILRALGGHSFEYGNDIDHSVPLGRGEKVFAWASFESGDCQVETPVVIGLDPDSLLAWGG